MQSTLTPQDTDPHDAFVIEPDVVLAARVPSPDPVRELLSHLAQKRTAETASGASAVAPTPAVETNSIFNLVSHVSAGQWSAIVPRQLLRFFGVPEGTVAIELVEPVARRTIGLVMSDREPPSPLARNLFAMQLPENIAALIQPPMRPSENLGNADR